MTTQVRKFNNTAISRRAFLQNLAIGAGALTLAACAVPATAPAAETGAATGGEAAAPSTAATTVTYWGSFTGANGEAESALVERFNDAHPDIFVDYQFQGSYEETAQKVTAGLQSGTAPDVSILSDVWWFKFYLNQALLPLDDLLTAADVDVSDYQDSLINEGVRRDVHYWIPFARSTPLFYYNKQMFADAGLEDRAPETWAEFQEWAPALNKPDAETPVSAFMHPNGASYIAWLFQGVVWQFGGKYSDPDFTMHMTHPDTLRAGQFYKDSVHAEGWAKPATDVQADFINGLTAAAMLSTGSMGGIRNNATFEWGTGFLPKETHFGCPTGGAGLSIIGGTPEERQGPAMTYIAFATNPENQTIWAQSTGYMPVRKSSLESAEMQSFFEEFPQFRTATEQLALTQPQDAARVFVPNGDQIIGAGLERITVQADDVAVAFADVQAILEEEAQPVIEALAAVEG